MANRGGHVRKDGRKDGRTDVWKFTPVSYRTSALWGRCPKKGQQEEEGAEEEGEEERKMEERERKKI